MWFWQITGKRECDYQAFANAYWAGMAERRRLNLFRKIELATGVAIAMTFA